MKIRWHVMAGSLLIAGVMQAQATVMWDGGGAANTALSNPTNWAGDTLPVNDPDKIGIIGGSYTAARTYITDFTGYHLILESNAVLTNRVGGSGTAASTMYLTNFTLTVRDNARFTVPDRTDSLNLNQAATVNVSNNAVLELGILRLSGETAGSVGNFYQYGGTVSANKLDINRAGTGIYHLYGGTLTVTNATKSSDNLTGSNYIDFATDSKGVFQWTGNQTNNMVGLITNGLIRFENRTLSPTNFLITYNSTNNLSSVQLSPELFKRVKLFIITGN